jgi:formylglycine-generating enzyme required for sulfatase activity
LALPQLGPQLGRALYLLQPLAPDGIREAIVGPAREKGARFESEALVETLVNATAGAEGGLPLLQFALAELWELRDGDVIRAAALEKLGGVAGALAKHADGVLLALRPAERKQAQRMLSKLVTVEGTRARRGEAELAAPGGDERAALEALIRGRLVVARESDEGAVYEIAHEALVRGWPSLRAWLEGAAETRAVKQRLERAVAEWERVGRREEALWNERQLTELSVVDAAELSAQEKNFVAASRRTVGRRRFRRRALLIGSVALVGLTYGGVRLYAAQQLADRVALHVGDADAGLTKARARSHDVEQARKKAFDAFDRDEGDSAEALWSSARAQAAEVEKLYANAGEALETALLLDGTRRDVKRRLVEVLYERALLSERDYRASEKDELLRRMRLYDTDGEMQRRWDAPATLTITTTPPAARVRIDRYVSDDNQHRVPTLVSEAGKTPLPATSLAPGSYLLTFTLPGYADVRYPVLLARAERFNAHIDLPGAAQVPPGFVYVPPGRFLYGSADETMRRSFSNTTPLHERTTGTYLIARTETTFAQWLEFLESLSPAERQKRLPNAALGLNGSIHLRQLESGKWQLSIAPTSHPYQALAGEPIRYAHRHRLANQDWLKFPVDGISRDDMQAYIAWVNRSAPTSKARLCSDAEWERAARGADDRIFPHADTLASDEANFDETYGKDPFAIGPDEVGAHPTSRSPFGTDDMAGNVWELISAKETVIRGGGFYFSRISETVSNRELTQDELRDTNVGFRLCRELRSK